MTEKATMKRKKSDPEPAPQLPLDRTQRQRDLCARFRGGAVADDLDRAARREMSGLLKFVEELSVTKTPALKLDELEKGRRDTVAEREIERAVDALERELKPKGGK